MKTLEELGISPYPWCGYWNEILDKDGFWVAKGADGDTETCENCTLIRAAPELYECLREAVGEACKRCYSHEDGECRLDGDTCIVQRWRAALKKAGGAE